LSSRKKILKNALINPIPILVGENKIEYLPEGIFSREELLQRSIELVHKAKRDGERIVQDAGAEAERILAQARQEREQIHKRAYEEGHSQGLQKGQQEGIQQGKQQVLNAQKPTIERLETIVSAAENSFARVCQQCEKELIDFIIDTAQKVIRQEIDRSDEIVMNVVRAAIVRASDRREISLRLHPEDLELVRVHEAGLLGEFDEIRVLRFEADQRISRGGCLLETASGWVDGRIEQQMSELAKSLKPLSPEISDKH